MTFDGAFLIDMLCLILDLDKQIAGPMWLGRLHNPEFLERVLKRLDTTDKELYKTSARMKGMMAVAKEVNLTSSCVPDGRKREELILGYGNFCFRLGTGIGRAVLLHTWKDGEFFQSGLS